MATCHKKKHCIKDFYFKTLEACKANICKLVVKNVKADQIEASDYYVNGEHFDNRYELQSTLVREEYDNVLPLFGNEVKDFTETIHLSKKLVLDNQSVNEIVTLDVKFLDVDNVTSYSVNVLVVYQVESDIKKDTFFYNIVTNQFDSVNPNSPVILPQYLLFSEARGSPPPGTLNINVPTIQFTNLEMQTFINYQNSLESGTQKITRPVSLLVKVVLHESSPLLSLETKSCTVKYSLPGSYTFSLSPYNFGDLFLITDTCSTDRALLENPEDFPCKNSTWIYNVGEKTINNVGTGKYITGSTFSGFCARQTLTLGGLEEPIKWSIQTIPDQPGRLDFFVENETDVRMHPESLGTVRAGVTLEGNLQFPRSWVLYTPRSECKK